jgi:uncharacterized delta-60 repeat protein
MVRSTRTGAGPALAETLERRALFTAASPDPTFGDAGVVRTGVELLIDLHDRADDVLVLADGKIVAAGGSTGSDPNENGIRLTRLLPDGSPDPAFGEGGNVLVLRFNDTAAVVALPGGQLLAAGTYLSREVGLVRINADGSLDKTFGADGTGIAHASPGGRASMYPADVQLQADGKIVVGGSAADATETGTDAFAARFTADGRVDPSFGTGGAAFANFARFDQVNAVAVTDSGKVVVSGPTPDGSAFLARFNPDGTPDNTFDADGKLTTRLYEGFQAYALAPYPGDRVVLGGSAYGPLPPAGPPRPQYHVLIRYNPDGSPDTTFDGDGILAVPFNYQPGEMQVVKDVAVEPGGGLVVTGPSIDPTVTPGNWAWGMGVLRYLPDGSRDTAFGAGRVAFAAFGDVRNLPNALALAPDGGVVVAGIAGEDSGNYHNTPDFGVARFTASGARDASFGGGDGSATVNFTRRVPATSVVAAAVVQQPDGKLVVAGTATYGGSDMTVTRLLPDGSPDATFGRGGTFTLDLSYQDFGFDLALLPNGKVLLLGEAARLGTGYDTALVRLNADGTPDGSFGIGGVVMTALSPQDDGPSDLEVLDDGRIVVGTMRSLARFLPDGTLDPAFGTGGTVALPGAGTSTGFGAGLAVLPDGRVFYALGPPISGGVNGAFYRFLPDGTPDPAFGTNGRVDPIAQVAVVRVLPDGTILTAGWSVTHDQVVARYHTDGTIDPYPGMESQRVWTIDAAVVEGPRDLLPLADGSVLLACYAHDSVIGLPESNTIPDSIAILRLLPDGTIDPSFGAGGVLRHVSNAFVSMLIAQADGRIVAAGGADGPQAVVTRYVLGVPLEARPGGPYAGTEGGPPVHVDGSGSVNAAGPIVKYEWDFDYNLVDFTPDAVGPAADVATPDSTAPGPVRRWALRVTDAAGLTNVAVVLPVIANVAPTATVTGPPPGPPLPEGTARITVSNPHDVAADLPLLRYGFDLNNDGDFTDPGDAANLAGTATGISFAVGVDGSYTARVRVSDKDGGFTDYFVPVAVTNVSPVLAAIPEDSLRVGGTFTLSGSFTDPGADPWSVTVNWGDGSAPQSVVPSSNKTFSATRRYAAAGIYTVTVRLSDDDDAVTRTAVVPVGVAGGRFVFYNHSAFDGNDAAAGAADDAAVATDKAALLPRQAASFANVSAYSRGINGLMVDLPSGSATAADFEVVAGTGGDPSTWAPVAAPAVRSRLNAGTHRAERVTLTWPDGLLRNTWVRVTVKANTRTGLAAPDVFYFGNLVGEVGDAAAPAGLPATVDARDAVLTRAALSRRGATAASRYDFNRDGRVNADDLAIALRATGRSLPALTAPAAAAAAFTILPSPQFDRAAPLRRREQYGLFGDVVVKVP